MGFLTPLFLAGLGALAVPVIIHLIRRERKEVVEFPSLMFLRKIPYPTVRRQKLRHLLLFALRCLAVVLLAAAFARPFFGRQMARITAPVGAREVVVLVDRSYSMGYGDRWARAVAAAHRATDGIGKGEHATVVLFDDVAAAVTQPTDDHRLLRVSVDTAHVGSRSTRYAPALKLAQRILEESQLPRREVVLVSDFQRRGWGDHEDVHLPEGTVFTRVDLSDTTAANAAITNVDFARDVIGDREQVVATARLANTGATPFTSDVSLTINGRVLETKRAAIPPRGTTMLAFSPFVLAGGATRGMIRMAPDALPKDNSYYFVLSRSQALSVLLLQPADAGSDASLYLERALAIGDRPPIRVTVRTVAQLAASDLTDRSLVILNDAPFPSGDMGRRVVDLVRRGGGLVIAAGDRTSPAEWGTQARELLPASVGAVADHSTERAATIGVLDRSHPIFELFSAPRSGDWAAPRFFKYRTLTPATGAAVLASFDDGSPALVERRVGDGTVVLWATPFDNRWSDLVLQPVFLPFAHQLARYAGGYAAHRPWLTVGQPVDVPRYIDAIEHGSGEGRASAVRGAFSGGSPETEAASGFVATAPSGARVRAPSSHTLELTEQGIYELRRVSDRPDQTQPIAANLDPAEADFSRLDPEELALAVKGGASGERRAASGAIATPADRERQQSVWWYLLAASVAVLAAETVLSNRLSNRRAGQASALAGGKGATGRTPRTARERLLRKEA